MQRIRTDKEYRCLLLESTAGGARLQHDGGRLVRFKLPEATRVLFHTRDVENPFSLLFVSLSRCTGVIF